MHAAVLGIHAIGPAYAAVAQKQAKHGIRLGGNVPPFRNCLTTPLRAFRPRRRHFVLREAERVAWVFGARVLGSVLDRGWVSLELGAVLVPPAEVRAGVAWAF